MMTTEKSEKTPYYAEHHAPMGSQGLWRTPNKKVPVKQQLPAYILGAPRISGTPWCATATMSKRRTQ